MNKEKIKVNDHIKDIFASFKTEMDWDTLVIDFQDDKRVYLRVEPVDKSFANARYYSTSTLLTEIDLGNIEPNYYDKDGKILTEYSIVRIPHYQVRNRMHYMHKLIVFNHTSKKWGYAHLNGEVITPLDCIRPIPIGRKIESFTFIGK